MPELPEVETIRRHLAPVLEGRRLDALEVLDPRWCAPLRPAELAAAVEGRTVERVGRRGKYLLLELADDVTLIVHLRMTGALLLSADAPYVRVRFAFDDGAVEATFSDPRRFGTGQLAIGRDALEAFFAGRLGPEPFDPAFTLAHLEAVTGASRAPIKAVLLDQRRMAGVGNIYADEALFAAGVHPARPAERLTRPQLARLLETIPAALMAGIEAKGASIDDFRDPDGVRGTFQDRFLVHRRAGEPCPSCGRLIRKLVVAGRGTYVCERCQPVPRTRSRPPMGSS